LAVAALCAGAASGASGADANSSYKKATLLLDDLRSVPQYELGPNQYQLVINSFRQVYAGGLRCAYCDMSLLAVANLFREMADRFGDAEHRAKAAEAYQLVLKYSPQNALRTEAEAALREMEGGVPAKTPPAKKEKRSAGTETAEATEIGEDVLDEESGAEVDDKEKAEASDAVRPSESVLAGKISPVAPPLEIPPTPVLNPAPSAPKPEKSGSSPARLKEVRFWTHPEYTRVVVEISGGVEYQYGEIPNPDRVYVDLFGALLPQNSRKGSTIEVNDSLLQRIRLGQNTRENTRVVFDLQQKVQYQASWLSNPARLVLEFRSMDAPVVLTKDRPSPGDTLQPVTLAKAEAVKNVLPAARDTRAPEPKAPRSRFLELAPPRVVVPSPRAVAALTVPELKAGHSLGPAVSDPLDLSKVRPPQPKLPPPKPAAASSAGNRNLIRALGLKIGRVVIDAGHGGHDTGSIGPTGVLEKDVVLDVALRLGKLIEENMGGEVIYIRSDDSFVPLRRRTLTANESNADLFISVHANASSDHTIRGVETYYLNFTTNSWAMGVAARENAAAENSVHELQDLVSKIALKEQLDESREFAAKVQAALHGGLVRDVKGLRNRGVRRAPLMVLIGAQMPSVLAEIGFISNARDEKLLKSDAFRQKVAQYIYDGVASYAETLSHVSVAQKQAVTP
jgi:N-acetylmuramoyl-L-alanine amidase